MIYCFFSGPLRGQNREMPEDRFSRYMYLPIVEKDENGVRQKRIAVYERQPQYGELNYWAFNGYDEDNYKNNQHFNYNFDLHTWMKTPL